MFYWNLRTLLSIATCTLTPCTMCLRYIYISYDSNTVLALRSHVLLNVHMHVFLKANPLWP